MSTSKTPFAVIAAIAFAAIAAVLGVQSTTTTTVAPTPNSELTMKTSENEMVASGQTTQSRPDGKTTTSFEAEVTSDGASIKYEQQHDINFPESLDEAGKSISDFNEKAADYLNNLNPQTE